MFDVITVASGAYAWNLKAKPATKAFSCGFGCSGTCKFGLKPARREGKTRK
jgi:hypothetical protein